MASGKTQAVPIKNWPFGQWPDRLRTITDANGERGWIQVSVAECRRLLSLATIGRQSATQWHVVSHTRLNHLAMHEFVTSARKEEKDGSIDCPNQSGWWKPIYPLRSSLLRFVYSLLVIRRKYLPSFLRLAVLRELC